MALECWAPGPKGLALAGLIGCSGYPHPGWTPQTPFKTKVLLTHGEQDACGALRGQ
jgi:predicted esterase